MSDTTESFDTHPNNSAPMADIRLVTDEKFNLKMGDMIERGEEMRISRSRSFNSRRRLYFITLSLMVAGTASYFVWFILMGGHINILILSLIATVILPTLLHLWSLGPAKRYQREYKTSFLPELAKALGDMTFRANGGISSKAVAPARILPPHDRYEAEDCFAGVFKDVKLMISEARLYRKKNGATPIWDGVLALLITQQKKFRGTTIITADQNTAKRWNKIRWKDLEQVSPAEEIDAAPFLIFSDTPEEARQLADEDLIQLLRTLAHMFDNARLSAVFYGGSRVLLSIPYKGDMFEPSGLHMPIANRNDTLKAKKEIEQILRAIDIIDVYEGDETLG